MSDKTTSKYFLLAKIQGEIDNVVASKTAGEGAKKSWKFADLASVQETIKTQLKDNNVSVVFTSTKQTEKTINFVYTTQYASKEVVSNIYEITAVLYFADADDTMEFTYEVPFDTNMSKAIDGWGGMTTYARRYILCMIFNIPIDDLKEPNLEKETVPAKQEQANEKPWLTFAELTEAKTRISNQDKKQMQAYVNDLNNQYRINNGMKTQIKEAVAKRAAELTQSLPNTDEIVNEYNV